MTLVIISYLIVAGLASGMYLDCWEQDLTLEKWVGTTVLFPVLVIKGLWLLVKCWWWLVQNLWDCVGLAWKTIW